MGLTSRTPVAKLGGIYKRLETDAEHRVRLRAAGKAPPSDLWGSALLDAFGDDAGIRRRIVESSAD